MSAGSHVSLLMGVVDGKYPLNSVINLEPKWGIIEHPPQSRMLSIISCRCCCCCCESDRIARHDSAASDTPSDVWSIPVCESCWPLLGYKRLSPSVYLHWHTFTLMLTDTLRTVPDSHSMTL